MHPAMSSQVLCNQRLLLLTWVGPQVAPPQSPPGPPSCVGDPSAHHTALFLLHYLDYLLACLPPPLEHKLLKSLQFYSLALLCFPSPQNSLRTCYIHHYHEDLLMAAVQTDAVDSRRVEMDGEAWEVWGGEEECHRIYTGKQGAGPCNKRKERGWRWSRGKLISMLMFYRRDSLSTARKTIFIRGHWGVYIKPHHRRALGEIKIKGLSSKRRDKSLL